jgi:uncharacterized phage protein (TIGR01671 family)
MRQTSFKYVFKHFRTGDIKTLIMTMDDLEEGNWGDVGEWEEDGYNCEARLQYTGLTDRNGKEIYDGDIVKLDDYDTHGDFGEYRIDFSGVFKVIWRDDLASFDLDKIEANVDGWHLSEDSKGSLEVIGNIYDNPELVSA